MQTIKIITGVTDEFSQQHDENSQITQLYEAVNVWHRPFLIKDLEQYAKWTNEYLKNSGGADGYEGHSVPGGDPYEMIKIADNDGIYFHFMSIELTNGKIQKFLLYACRVYIMNEAGQTVDQFYA